MVVEGQMVDARHEPIAGRPGIVCAVAGLRTKTWSLSNWTGIAVSPSYLPDRKFRRDNYVYPPWMRRPQARVRMEFHNPGYFLKPGMFATVELQRS